MGITIITQAFHYFCAVKEPIKLVILISGKGSNARNLVNYFKQHLEARVYGVLSSKQNPEMESYCIENQLFYQEFTPWNEAQALDVLKSQGYGAVILAGFLKKISAEFITSFSNRIINIHPSLLPKYGGSGMYGRRVHEAVFTNRETKTGITIHLVNEHYDEGEILEQHECTIQADDTPIMIAAKVQELEYQFFPSAVEHYCLSLKR
jgi:phosphoribosylglycinamide formyltransferase-1